MKAHISSLIKHSLEDLVREGIIDALPPKIIVTHSKNKAHGDFASNIALMLSKQAKLAPRVLAEQIITHLPPSASIMKSEVAGAGFINFFLAKAASNAVITDILSAQTNYGQSDIGGTKRILIEFVSANPTGPLHVGHGRGAALGSALAQLMTTMGFAVDCEYYINDAGRQMDILVTSVLLRYLERLGASPQFPDNAYQGEYIYDIAEALYQEYRDKWQHISVIITEDSTIITEDNDKEAQIDAWIKILKTQLKDDFQLILDMALQHILSEIKTELSDFRVQFDHWFSERQLLQSDALAQTIDALHARGVLYQKDQALWFASSKFGDEKDRVIQRANGAYTYFATDIAYHVDKLTRRGYDKLINIWGADHHGYVARIRAALQALGFDSDRLVVLLVQFVNLYRANHKLSMSTRAGSFIPLQTLRTEVGNDSTRFFYLLRRSDQHLDFDIDLATAANNDNPVFYIQYAHARINQVLSKATSPPQSDQADLALLTSVEEQDLIKCLARYTATLDQAARQYALHQLTHYLQQLATAFHRYYANQTFLTDDAITTNARLCLISATKQVIQNALGILGVRAPDKM